MTTTHDSTAVRVAIVDDSEDLRLMLRLTLQNDSRFVVTGEAEDGFGALDIADTNPPDLMLLDLAMPGMDGLTALQRIRERHPADEPVIVILSAFPPIEYEDAARQAGAAGYIQKGANLMNLANQVWSEWDRSHLHDPNTVLRLHDDTNGNGNGNGDGDPASEQG